MNPELGQIAFSNGVTLRCDPEPEDIEMVQAIGTTAAMLGLVADTPCVNNGQQFVCAAFAIRAYCWCDGDGDHKDGCPPNFECGDYRMNWYKHANRGCTSSRKLTSAERAEILAKCLTAILKLHKDGES